MLRGMDVRRVLLMDTCGAAGSVALADGERVAARAAIAERAASARLLAVVEEVLATAGWGLGDVEAVGVVSGPGSFTGVRVGLAAAKGLCEGLGVPMAAVSRLEVLADAGGVAGDGIGGAGGRARRGVCAWERWRGAVDAAGGAG